MKKKVRKIVVEGQEYCWRTLQKWGDEDLTVKIWKDKHNLIYKEFFNSKYCKSKYDCSVTPKYIENVIKEIYEKR